MGRSHFLAFYGWSQNCHSTGGYVIQMLMYYNEHIIRIKVYWKSNLLDLCFQLVYVISSGYVILLKVVPCPLPSYFTYISNSHTLIYSIPIYILICMLYMGIHMDFHYHGLVKPVPQQHSLHLSYHVMLAISNHTRHKL